MIVKNGKLIITFVENKKQLKKKMIQIAKKN